MELKGKKVGILIEDMYNDLEFWYPYYRLKEAGADVVIIGPEAGKVYNGKSGIKAKSDRGMDQVDASGIDGLIIPGGYAPDLMRRHTAMVKLVRDSVISEKMVAAICHAGWMLASADVLQGRTVTSFFAIKDDMVHAGADYVDREVVIDERMVTSRKPDDLPAFMQGIIKVLNT